MRCTICMHVLLATALGAQPQTFVSVTLRLCILNVTLSCAGVALAGCPNHCGGHGTCSSNDVCTCFPGFEGFDCSLRTCPKGQAWATNAVDPHSYSECSAQGSCNRNTGDCDCFAGFGGFACTRSMFPTLLTPPIVTSTKSSSCLQ
jgi:hypothetical protein